MTIPAELASGSYTLHVFSEQCNGDLRTDYASGFADISLTVGGSEPTPTPTSIEGAKVVLSKTSFTYNAKIQKPTVKTVGGKALTEGVDYTATWSNAASKAAGTYKVTLKGKGDYTGTATATYKIAKAANPMKATAKKPAVSAKKLKSKKRVVKRAKAIAVSKAQGKLTFSKVKGNKKISVNKKNGNITVGKGLKKGTYIVQVKVKAAGNGNYKAKAQTVKVKIVVK